MVFNTLPFEDQEVKNPDDSNIFNKKHFENFCKKIINIHEKYYIINCNATLNIQHANNNKYLIDETLTQKPSFLEKNVVNNIINDNLIIKLLKDFIKENITFCDTTYCQNISMEYINKRFTEYLKEHTQNKLPYISYINFINKVLSDNLCKDNTYKNIKFNENIDVSSGNITMCIRTENYEMGTQLTDELIISKKHDFIKFNNSKKVESKFIIEEFIENDSDEDDDITEIIETNKSQKQNSIEYYKNVMDKFIEQIDCEPDAINVLTKIKEMKTMLKSFEDKIVLSISNIYSRI